MRSSSHLQTSTYRWGTLEDVAYCKKLSILVTLTEEIENAYAAIPLDTSAKLSQAVVYWTNKCLEVKGHHFVHLF